MISQFLLAAALWQSGAPLPVARAEVAAANWREYVVVVGGETSNGEASARVDAYNSRIGEWMRLPDLPVAVRHPMAAAGGGTLFVFGGDGGDGRPRRDAFELPTARGWVRLRSMPAGRTSGGAAFDGNKLYVVGGVGPHGLARTMLVYDAFRRRWQTLPGPRPREGLGVSEGLELSGSRFGHAREKHAKE